MGARNLPNQSQPQTKPFGLGICAYRPIERLEDLLAFVFGNTDATILHNQLRVPRRALVDSDGSCTSSVTLRVVQEITHQPSQKAGISMNDHRLAFHRAIEVRRLL